MPISTDRARVRRWALARATVDEAMETRAPYVLVGAFVLLFVAGLLIAVLWFARVQFREEVTYYDIYFQGSVTGLNPASTVRYNGLPVGRVGEIKLDPTDPTKVRVTVELQPGVPIKTDTVASLEIQGVTGGSYVNLTGGTREAPVLTREEGQRYPVIPSRQSGLERVVQGAPELLNRIITLTDQLNALLSPENRQAVSDTLQNFRKVSEAAAGHTDDIDHALDDGAKALHDLHQTLDTTNDILAQLKLMVAPNGDMQATLKSINETTRQIGDLAQRVDRTVAENEPQVHAFTTTGFDQLQQLVRQSQELVAQLSRIADSLSRDPSRLLYGDRREGYRPQ
jgi:phospholipid/cholesterol/gamma-HCH transport system substrate-binding protein